MEKIDVINTVLKISLINIFTYFVYIKVINYKENNFCKTMIIVGVSVIEAIIELTFYKVATLIRLLCIYVLYGLLIAMITKKKFYYSIVITFISLVITYLINISSVIIIGILLKIIYPNINPNRVYAIMLIAILESTIIHFIFEIKRLRNGVQFLQDEDKINSLGILGNLFIGITIFIYAMIDRVYTWQSLTFLFIGLSIEAICLFIWIKKKITIYYKQKLKEQTVADLQNEIKEKDNKINEILEENKAIATINHKYSSRIKALEEFSSKIVSKPELVEKMKTEFGEDYTAFAAQIKRISQEYSNEMKTKVTKENAIPKTGIFGIDTLLEHMSTEATKSNISLDVKINASINYMVEDIISESALETLLGDHIKDAIIAINCSNNTNRRILVVISIVDKCYEINFYDTGIEFEIDTLIKLGKEQITTHKETGRKRNRLYDHIWDIKQNKRKLNYRREAPHE